MNDPMEEPVKDFYREKIGLYGPTPRGLDYGSEARQQLCFEQLMKIWRQPSEPASIIDYGCGYGALVDFLEKQGYNFTAYTGYDLTDAVIKEADKLYGERPHCTFVADRSQIKPADYTVAVGVFNIRLTVPDDVWLQYILEQINFMWSLSTKGMAFNILTKYSDPEKMRPDLYYADPGFLFDYCKRHFARNVALLHDYEVYEFTILVRR